MEIVAKPITTIALLDHQPNHAASLLQAINECRPHPEVTAFMSVPIFMAALSRHPFDLLCLDLHPPDMDGLRLLDLVRNEAPDTPIVAMVNPGEEWLAAAALQSGASDFMIKRSDYLSGLPGTLKAASEGCQLILKTHKRSKKNRAADKLEMITTLASTLNHEINNPLMAILGNIELLLDNPRIMADELQEKLTLIADSARRIQSITHRMESLMIASVRQTPVGPMLDLKTMEESANHSCAVAVPDADEKRI